MPKPLAEIIVDAGLLTRAQVLDASRQADASGLPFVVPLVRTLGLDELSLVSAVRRQMRVPVADPGHVKLDPDALRTLSRDTCRRLRVLPLSVAIYSQGPRLLRLAMADPTDAVAIAEVEHLTGYQVEVAIMPLSAVEEMIETGYKQFVTEVMKRKPAFSGNLRTSPRRPASDTDVAALTQSSERAEPTENPAGNATGDDPASVDENPPTTLPYHRLSDEAHVGLRHQALLDLLIEKKIISEDEYEERVRQLMKLDSGES